MSKKSADTDDTRTKAAVASTLKLDNLNARLDAIEERPKGIGGQPRAA